MIWSLCCTNLSGGQWVSRRVRVSSNQFQKCRVRVGRLKEKDTTPLLDGQTDIREGLRLIGYSHQRKGCWPAWADDVYHVCYCIPVWYDTCVSGKVSKWGRQHNYSNVNWSKDGSLSSCSERSPFLFDTAHSVSTLKVVRSKSCLENRFSEGPVWFIILSVRPSTTWTVFISVFVSQGRRGSRQE